MKKLLNFEMKRTLHSKGFWISLGIGVVIALFDFFTYGLAWSRELVGLDECREYILFIPVKVAENWLGGKVYWTSKALLFLLPLLSVLPFAYSFYGDMSDGMINVLCTRISKKVYMKCKYIVTFVSGMIAVIIPWLINYMLCLLVMPSINPQVASLADHIHANDSYAWLYYHHNNIYIILSIIILGLYAGVLAVSALYASFYANKIYTVYIYPYMIYIGFVCLFDLLGFKNWEPINMLDPVFSGGKLIPFIVEFVILMSISIYEFFIKSKERDNVN